MIKSNYVLTSTGIIYVFVKRYKISIMKILKKSFPVILFLITLAGSAQMATAQKKIKRFERFHY